jgi:hypothetical protein
MNTLLKACCLGIYLLALAGLAVDLPFNMTSTVQYAAMILLGGHALEIPVAFRSVKLYKGPVAASIGLTLLFGFLHWLPLVRAHARATSNR